MDYSAILIWLLLLLLVGGLYYRLVTWPEQRRAQALRAWAGVRGYTVYSRDADPPRPSGALPSLFALGDRNRRVGLCIQGRRAAVDFWLFDYEYTLVQLTGFSRRERTVQQTVLALGAAGLPTPAWVVWPAALAEQTPLAAAEPEIEVTDEAFTAGNYLYGRPAGVVRARFGRRQQEFYGQQTAPATEGEGKRVWVYYPGQRVSADTDKIEDFIALGLQVLDLFSHSRGEG